MKRALITGITGQDGSHLADLLLSKGYQVHGLVRRASLPTTDRLAHLSVGSEVHSRVQLHWGDITDTVMVQRLISEVQPAEIYNLAAQSHVAVSFESPGYTMDATGAAVVRLLEAIRVEAPESRFYQASSSEMFGSADPPQDESTRFHPRSPYAVAKTMAHYATVNYREAYGLFCSSGILFNHEGERRGPDFVTQKIARAAAAISVGLQDELVLGNLDARRDWGYAPDYVHGMWMMLQAEEASDYVLATGESHTVREFCMLAFDRLGLDWQKYTRTDERYHRPAEVDHLEGFAAKAELELGWKPETSFAELVRRMVDTQRRLLDDRSQSRSTEEQPSAYPHQ